MYEFRNLKDVDAEVLAATWNLAFSDYIVPMNITPEGIDAYFKVSGVDKSQSFGAFYEGALVGMLVNSVGSFKGQVVAYDAMTGIIPDHRGKGLFSQLFEHAKNSLKSNGITQYYLEVITTNENAYSIYQKKGGKTVRELTCLKGKMDSDFYIHAEVSVLPLSAFPIEEFSQYQPSYGNQIIALHRNIDDYQVAYVQNQNNKVAVIFKKQGGIAQIKWDGAASKDLLYAVLTYLSQKSENLSIINIPTTETQLINELLNIGLKVLVHQYEMCIEL